MYPFLPHELGARFSLETALRFGTLPIVFTAEDPADTLTDYVQSYLKEEIQAEALVRNLPGFARFLPTAALFHGQVLSSSSLARDAGVARTTVNDYLEILEDTLLAFRLPAYEAQLRARERHHPKLYWVDAGLVRAIKRQVGPVAHEEIGPLFEGLVAMILRALDEYQGLFDDMGYWASSGGLEVDFVLSRGKRRIAIETKASERFRSDDTRGLDALAELPGIHRRLLVYRGHQRLKTERGVEVLRFEDLLVELSLGSLWR
jgi:predicted AAA+ superfamily ATPase